MDDNDTEISKYFLNTLSDEEKLFLLNHLEHDDAARDEFVRLHNVWGLSELLPRPGDKQLADAGANRLQKRIKRKSSPRILNVLKYAAVFCAVFASAWYLSILNMQHENDGGGARYTEIQVPTGQRVQMNLPDGSLVWLSPKTLLRIPSDFGRKARFIELDGEGFFHVATDAKKPFIVQSKGYNIQALGTKFNVFSYSKSPRFEASLVEGKVHVYSGSDPQDNVYLSPEEKASLVNDKLVKSASSNFQEDYFTNGIYNFQSTPFIDILDYLSLWHDVRFRIGGSVLLTPRVSAKFRQNDTLEDQLKALQNVFQFKFKRLDDNRIEIYK